MAEKVRISRSRVLEVMDWAGYGTAENWDNDKLADKILNIRLVTEDKEAETDSVAETLLLVDATQEDGQEFEVVDDDKESKSEEPEKETEKEDESVEVKESETETKEQPKDTSKEDKKKAKEEEKAKKEKEKADKKAEKEAEKTRKKEEKEKKAEDKAAAKKLKEEEEAKAKEPDFHYKTYATDEVRFEVIPALTVAQAKEYLRANVENRPYKPAIAKRYAEDIIRKEWKQTLQPLIFDTVGMGVNLQHRLHGLLIAEELRLKNPDYYKETYGWDDEVTMPVVVAFGADPSGNDYHDRGQIRSGADVLFRRSEFGDLKESDRKKLTRDLAVAARLCWLKLGKMKVSDAPHFPHSEMLSFIDSHPKLRDMVEFVYEEDRGEGKEKRIVKYLKSRGYLAALVYLFGISDTDKENYPENPEDLNYNKWEAAQEFVTKFAAGTFEDENHPIHRLRGWLIEEMAKPKKPSRDIKVDMIIKIWKVYAAGEDIEAKQMKLKKKEDLSIGSLIG